MLANFFSSLDEPDGLVECAKQNEQRNTEMFDWKYLMPLVPWKEDQVSQETKKIFY